MQRPASVVKELMENSVDAESSQIDLIVKEAGKLLIQVIDNGKGMSVTDARMSFERHATSKIIKSEDLFSIRTFGFRGEALASIGAVAQVEMRTRKQDDELGTSIKVEGSEVKEQTPIACEKGTSISVKNLFFNVPARRSFLKSNPVEMKHIIDEFQRVALSYPQVGFRLYQNDLEVYQLPSEKLSRRIVSLFGSGYKEQLITCQEDMDFIKIHGYIGKPEHAKKTRGEQFFFVNNRFVRNNYLHHAIMNAYEDLIASDQFPFYVLFIDIDPRHIDINVHPTKTEIKFDDEKIVYALVKAAVKKSLGTHSITPPLDFEHNINFDALSNYNHSKTIQGDNERLETNFTAKSFNPIQKSSHQDWQKLYEGFERVPEKNGEEKEETPSSVRVESAANNMESGVSKDLLYTENASTFQLHGRYIITQIKSGVLVVDQQAAHERILYERYLAMLHNKVGASQQFLFPQSVQLSPGDFALIAEMEEEIRSLGFMFNIFSNNTVVINGVPADVQSGSEKELFEGLIEQFKMNRSELKLDKKENLARALARRSAIRSGTKLTLLEMNTLIDELFACKFPNYTPTGNLTIVTMEIGKIAKLFNRQV